MKRKQEQAEEVADVTTQVRVMLLGDGDRFFNLAKEGEPDDIRKAGEVVDVDADFAEKLIENKYAKKVAQD